MNKNLPEKIRCLDSQGSHELAYYQWGNSDNPQIVLCIHGIFGGGLEFSELAQHLAPHYRVICPDLPGRRASSFLAQPEDYGLRQYCQDLTTLLAHLNTQSVLVVGTSLGGVIGMMMATAPNSPVRGLILNDIGPVIPDVALKWLVRIGERGAALGFDESAQFIPYLQQFNPGGKHFSAEQWQNLAEQSVMRDAKGQLKLAYDPAILVNLKTAIEHNKPAWKVWEAITCPIFLLRAENSAFLLDETVQQMQTLQPTMQMHLFSGAEHPLSLCQQAEIDVVTGWCNSML